MVMRSHVFLPVLIFMFGWVCCKVQQNAEKSKKSIDYGCITIMHFNREG